ncbi:DUF6151 family protein [Balneatrix alpica]|uniref:DUF6151 family protein n=1 Tax=Balneatrix alpica TaxID=75684 RepID=UPI0027390E0E|nr:DUF6151 family protein [Balneatrix alpica]
MHQVKCQCGAVQGRLLKGAPNNRIRCYCSDCQAFARYFDPGLQVLDAQGGTEIVQVCQSRLCFDRGLENVAAIRLTNTGMIRWYAQCCQTPIGNVMADPKMSFIGLIHTCLDKSALDKDFGPSVSAFNTQDALGDPKPQSRGLLRSLLRFMRLVLLSRVFGRYKKSPLFSASGAPIVTPKILAASELQKLKTAV